MSPFRKFRSFATLMLIGSALSGCSIASRLSQVGMEPPLTTIQNPTTLPNYRPVALPMPAPVSQERQANSLWRQGSRAFFKDQRASQIGDILTVVINIEDEAKLNNRTSRSRDASEGASLPALFGLESTLEKILPGDPDMSNLVEAGSESNSAGAGAVNREEDINLRVAALITQVLPNGNLVLSGRQEVRVNYEVRELFVAGVIRPADITSTNTIAYDKIAEARVSYGGRGHISDIQQPRYGQQIFDIIAPF